MKKIPVISIVMLMVLLLPGCVSSAAVSAEEYFAIGMAYFDMGRFAEAEQWLNRARSRDRTMSASEYNLGRIAFETGRFDEAIRHFEAVLRRDSTNVLALRAVAYTYIRNGDIEKADAVYSRLLELVPESADDGYNHALVLFAMEKYAEAEQVLSSYEFALLENNDVLLLFARAQKEQDKPEAIDSYANWLAHNNDTRVQFEFAQLLESHDLFARALEEYREIYTALSVASTNPARPEVRFTIARLLLIADSDRNEGVTELQGAVQEGFDDFDAIEELLDDDRISAVNKVEIRVIITEGLRAAEEAASEAADDPIEETEDEIFGE